MRYVFSIGVSGCFLVSSYMLTACALEHQTDPTSETERPEAGLASRQSQQLSFVTEAAALRTGSVAALVQSHASTTFTPDALRPWAGRWCTQVGAACCPPDSEVLTQHCLEGLGCNVATGMCEPCGKPGQVCCDGPLSGFSGKSYILPLNPEAAEACQQPAACETRLENGQWTGPRVCRSCGTRPGGACCPPDVRYALGRCEGTDNVYGARLTCDDPWASSGTCVACGRLNMPACMAGQPCDAGGSERNGICVPCGYPGQVSCDGVCDAYSAHLDRKSDTCLDAGALNEPCADGSLKCHYEGLACDAQNFCRQVQGRPGQPCYSHGQCDPDASCMSGTCRSCGLTNSPCCGNACHNSGDACVDGTCRQQSKPSAPQQGNDWKTCGGTPYTLQTQTHYVPIQQPSGCAVGAPFVANSYSEALACAKAAYGAAVIEDAVESYQFALSNAYGCTSLTFYAANEENAENCAQAYCGNCVLTPGACF